MTYLDVTGGCTLPLQSGIPRTTRAIARRLSAQRPDVMLLRWQPFRAGYTRLSAHAAALLENHPRVPSPRAPRDATGPLLAAALRDLAAWPAAVPLQRMLGSDDTLLVTSLFPDNRLGLIAKLAAGPGRVVAIFHDAIPLRDPNLKRWERRHHLRALRVLSRLDLIIAVSHAARTDLLSLLTVERLPVPTIEVIPWPVPFEATRPSFTPPDEAAKTILYVSRLKAVKNQAALLAACELLWANGMSFSLQLIGCEDEAHESDAILREVRGLQQRGRAVTWRAQVSEDELHAAYTNATFTVFPSRREGFGLPIIESFWHGRGVICSGDDAMGEVSGGPGAMPVDVSQAEELAGAMRSLLIDQAACLALAQAAYGRPQRTWDDYIGDLEGALAA